MASTIPNLLQQRYDGDINYLKDEMTCSYDNARGTIKISANNQFQILPNSEVIYLTENAGPIFIWVGNNHELISIDLTNLRSINEALRNDGYVPSIRYDGFTTYESGFIDLLNVHNIYTHCPNLGHYRTIGVKGENRIIKKVPVSSSFGYQILDSVVAPHEKMMLFGKALRQCILLLRMCMVMLFIYTELMCRLALYFETSNNYSILKLFCQKNIHIYIYIYIYIVNKWLKRNPENRLRK